MTSSTVHTRRISAPAAAARPKMAPKPTPETAHFWACATEERLVVQRCSKCHTTYFYPRDLCPSCSSERVEWIDCSGRATLHTYVIEHRPGPGFENDGPYVVAVVELEEGPRMMTNIVGVDPDPDLLPLDLPLVVQFEDRGDVKVPVFRPEGSNE